MYEDDRVWTQYAINSRSIALRRRFGDWYFDRSSDTRLKDCNDFPCNPTCSDIEMTTATPPSGAGATFFSPFLAVLVMMMAFVLV